MNRPVRRSAVIAAVLALLTAAACGGADDGQAAPADEPTSQSPAATDEATAPESTDTSETMEPGDEPTSESPAEAASTVTTAESEFGPILVDSEGMTLYMFDPDEQGDSVCDADCLEAWPPVEGPAQAGEGVDASMLGTAQATDGTTMATYNDWPLYYWVDDQQPGDTTGQAVGDVWWVMGPDGEPIREQPEQGGGGP